MRINWFFSEKINSFTHGKFFLTSLIRRRMKNILQSFFQSKQIPFTKISYFLTFIYSINNVLIHKLSIKFVKISKKVY